MEEGSQSSLRCIYSDNFFQGTPIQAGDNISWHFASFKGLQTASSIFLESSFDKPACIGIIHQSSDQNYVSENCYQWLLSLGHCHCLKLGEKSIWQFWNGTEEIIFFIHIIGVNDQQIPPHLNLSFRLEEFRRQTHSELWTLFHPPSVQEEEHRDLEQYYFTIISIASLWRNGKIVDNVKLATDIKLLINRRLMHEAFAAPALRRINERCREFEETIEAMGAPGY